MIYCNKCGYELSNGSLFCSKCGNRIDIEKEIANEKEEISITTKESQENLKEVTKNKRVSTRIKLLGAIALCIALIGGSVMIYFNFMTPEAQARSVVDKYLHAIKNGKSTSEFKDYGVNDYRNVLNYKFLNVEISTQENVIEEFSVSEWNDFWKEYYPNQETFSEFKEEMKSIINGKVLIDSISSLKIETDQKYNVIYLLYDVEVTNGFGQKVYTKTTFKVDNSSGKYKVRFFLE